MIKYIRSKLEFYPMEIRALIYAGLGGVAFSVLSGFVTLVLNLGFNMIMASLVAGVVSSLVVYFAAVKRYYKAPAYLGILSAVVIIYPIMWFYNGGSYGPMMFFMLFNAVFASLLLAYLNYKIVLLVQLCIFYLLMYIEYKNPDLIVGYSREFTRVLDIGFAFTSVFLLTFYLVSKIMSEYNKNIKELEQVRQKLLDINSKLVVVSETDELTGVCNRRHIMSLLKRLMLLNDSQNLSLIMMDIDYFKSVNDTYGHSVGDQVIKRVSQTLEKNLRRTDTLGRIGGEEFLIVLPNTPIDAAYDKAELLRVAIENLTWEYEGLVVTISGGVHFGKETESLDELLEKVDKQLYFVKNSGRNRISREW